MTPAVRARAVLLVVLALLVGACSGPPPGAVASIDGQGISEELFERIVRSRVADPEGAFVEVPTGERAQRIEVLQRQVLTQLIRMEVISQAAEGRGLSVSDEQVEEAWQNEILLQPEGEQGLRDLLARLGLDEAGARAQLAAGLLLQKLQEDLSAQIEVPDADVQQLFAERSGTYERVRASHILVETEDEAQQIVELVRTGEAEFEELARQRSQDPGSGPLGGSLGEQPRGTFVEPFEEAVWTAEEGELVGPVETTFGWHVIRVDEFINLTYEDVEQQLREELRGRALQEQQQRFQEDLFASAAITVDSRFGRWDALRAEVLPATPLAPELPPES